MPNKSLISRINILLNLLVVFSLLFVQASPVVQAATIESVPSSIESHMIQESIPEILDSSTDRLSDRPIVIDSRQLQDGLAQSGAGSPEENFLDISTNKLELIDLTSQDTKDSYFVYLPLILRNSGQTPTPGPDLALTISDNDITVDPGSIVSYIISYINNGSKDATGVTLSATLPENTTFRAAGSTPGWQQVDASNLYTLELGSLLSGQNGQATFAVTIPDPVPAGITQIQTSATITDDGSQGIDPNTSNNSDSESTPINSPAGQPDLSIVVSDGDVEVSPDGSIVYTLEYANHGSAPSSGVVLTETLPANTIFNDSASTPGWQAGDNDLYMLQIGDLAISATGSVSFAVDIHATVPAGVETIDNAALIADDGSNGIDPDLTDNVSTIATTLNAQPDLAITVDDGGLPVIPGGTLSYAIHYTNSGNQGATGIVLTAELPEFTTFDAVSSTEGWQQIGTTSTYQLLISSLTATAQGEAVFAGTIINPAPAGLDSISSSFTITDDGSNSEDPTTINNAANSTTLLNAVPDLTLTKTDDADYVQPGDTILYTLQFANSGNQDATGVNLTETLPVNTTFDEINSTAGWNQVGSSDQYIYSVNSLHASASGNLQFAVIVTSTPPEGMDAIDNTALIGDDGANGADPNSANNTATLTTPISLAPDLGITKTGPALTQPGSLLKYNLAYTNIGYSAANQVVITEMVPENTVFNAAESDPAWVQVGTTTQYTYAIASLEHNATGEVVFAVTVDSPISPGTFSVTNTASISDDGLNGLDPNLENNSSQLDSLFSTGPTSVCGALTANTTWTLDKSPYVLTCDVTVNLGVTLTIEPGTIIKPNAASRKITVNGTLLAQGTADAPVYFTSYYDDSIGGNTDGGTTAPAAEDWAYIYVGGQVNLNHTVLRYGGGYSSYGSLRVSGNGSATLDHVTVSDSYAKGVFLDSSTTNYSASLTITNSIIENNTGSIGIDATRTGGSASLSVTNSIIRGNSIGIRISGFQPLNISGNQFYNNSSYGLMNAGTSPIVIVARNNWWGSSSGPAPFGSGNRINYRTCTDSVSHITYICEYYVDVSPWLGQTETYGSSTYYQELVADPVNTATGNYAYSQTDLSISTRSFPLQFTRAYNSAYPENGIMGYGWTHSYNVRVVESSLDSAATVYFGDGHTERFVWDGSGYVAPAGIYSSLEKIAGLFQLTLKDQTVYNFDSLFRLVTIVDRNGNTTILTYAGNSLSQVVAPDGRTLAFTYNGSGKLAQISDPLTRTVQYGYDADGNLITVTDPNAQVTTFTYDANHRLLSITDANGHIFLANVYNSEGRVVEQYDAQDNLTVFDYDILTHITIVTDALNHSTEYQYDADLRLIGETNSLDKTESYTYDANNNRTSVTDRNNHTTAYTYDNRGNVLTVTDAKSGLATYTYNNWNQVLTITDPNNQLTSCSYDGQGNRLTATDALNHTTLFDYYEDANRLGLLYTITDPLNHTTTYDYNIQGDITSISDPLNNTQTYTYDSGGRKLTFTDARIHTWTYTYDNLNRLLTETDPLGGVTTSIYDDVGNLLSKEDANHNITTFTYTVKDQLATVTDAAGYVTAYDYDVVGNRISETDGNNHSTTYGYDAANRLISVTNPLDQMVTYGYDDAGNRTTLTDALNHSTTTTYDELNRAITITDALGHATATTYDAVGNVLTITDANDHTTTYSYTELNQLETVTDALGGVVTYSYDEVGNRTSMQDANLHVTNYSYDQINRLTDVSDPLYHSTTHTYDANGNRSNTLDANGHTITYTYDELNRLTAIDYDDATSVAYSYDAAGNRLTMVDGLGITTYTYDDLYRPLSISSPTGTTSYTYDAFNRLSLTTPVGTTTYGYDAADRLITVSDWQNQVTTYSYDVAGRQTGIVYPNGVTNTNTYDDADRLTNITTLIGVTTLSSITYTMDNVGNRLTMVDGDGITTYTYDDLNRLLSALYPLGSPTTVSYSYDPMGNRLTMSEDGVVTTYTYNNADQLMSTLKSAFTVNYSWDNNGNMLTKGSQTLTWDRAGRLSGLTNGTTTASYRYNGDGVRLGKTVDGVITSYLQDQAAGLPFVVRETFGATTNDYVYGTDLIATNNSGWSFFHTDGLGSTRLLTDLVGAVTDSYSYDAFGSERIHAGSSGQPFTYTGEQVDPEAGLVFLRTRYYDPLTGTFISKDLYPISYIQTEELNRYIYVGQNPIVRIDPSGEFFVELISLLPIPGFGLLEKHFEDPDAGPASFSDLPKYATDIIDVAKLLPPGFTDSFSFSKSIVTGEFFSFEKDKKFVKGLSSEAVKIGSVFINAFKDWWEFRKNGYRFSFNLIGQAYAAEASPGDFIDTDWSTPQCKK